MPSPGGALASPRRGALLFGTAPDPCHALPASPPHPLRYSAALTRIRSFHRLSDGLTTLALVDLHPTNIEGGRASAAIAASRFGSALKISEDGLISFYHHGKHMWDM